MLTVRSAALAAMLATSPALAAGEPPSASPPATPPAKELPQVDKVDRQAEMPPFLAPYYLSALEIEGAPARFVSSELRENRPRYNYVSASGKVRLAIDQIPCDGVACTTIFDNVARFLDDQASKNRGQFRHLTAGELHADWSVGQSEIVTIVVRFQSSLQFWTYQTPFGWAEKTGLAFDRLLLPVNRQRYEEAMRGGNVEMGQWGGAVHDWARALLKAGDKPGGLKVLRDLLATSPTDYLAHVEFAEATSDGAAAWESARIVLKSAEDTVLLQRAARVLQLDDPTVGKVPPLARGERGLQVILLPLQPCNALVLAEAAEIFGKIVDLPVKIAQLPEAWRFGRPDRIANEKLARQAIIQARGPAVDFTGWAKLRYQDELLKIAAGQGALARFRTREFVNRLDEQPGQYLTEGHVQRLVTTLAGLRSDDKRTIYVGVTEVDLYSGDNNYVFSSWTAASGVGVGGLGASVLSYHRMLAKTWGTPFESRRRLAERLAKELVPAALKSLDIPRPTDPSDPYSYASGLDRLDQKTLVLSEPVKDALARFR